GLVAVGVLRVFGVHRVDVYYFTVFLVFFFQAEDGIRDFHVTGVQTCALPISSFDALKMYLADSGTPGLIDGFTPEQRFFMSWATVWRTKMRDEALKTRIKTDPHSPGMYRATQPLINMEVFYKAFDIKPGDGMYLEPEERVKIW